MLSSTKVEMKDKLTSELAELAGMLVADGCIQKNYLCLWGNITEDKEYYEEIIKLLFFKVFNVKIKTHEKKSNSVYGFYLCSKEIISFLNQELNFSIGNKTYDVSVPPQIFNSTNNEIICSFIRGYVDCDGCLNFTRQFGKYCEFKRKHHTYPRIFISSVSKQLIEQISELLLRLGIKHYLRQITPKDIKCAKVHIITINGIKRLNQWMNLIGFNNPSKISKYLVWKKFGFCPSNTKHAERQKLLKGEINPYSYYS
jgi:intein/homing endonuclease